MIFAVVPAAGLSSRMGRPKLSLPLGGRTVLEHVVAALRQGGVDEVLVVVGPHDPGLAALAEAAGPCVLAPAGSHGRHAGDGGTGPALAGGALSPAAGRRLAAGAGRPPDARRGRGAAAVRRPTPLGRPQSIVVPVHEGRRGHPTLIAWRHVAGHSGPSGREGHQRLFAVAARANAGDPGAKRGGAVRPGYAGRLRTAPARRGRFPMKRRQFSPAARAAWRQLADCQAEWRLRE